MFSIKEAFPEFDSTFFWGQSVLPQKHAQCSGRKRCFSSSWNTSNGIMMHSAVTGQKTSGYECKNHSSSFQLPFFLARLSLLDHRSTICCSPPFLTLWNFQSCPTSKKKLDNSAAAAQKWWKLAQKPKLNLLLSISDNLTMNCIFWFFVGAFTFSSSAMAQPLTAFLWLSNHLSGSIPTCNASHNCLEKGSFG